MPYGALEIKNNLIGVMVFKIHIWIMIWNSWKLPHVLWPSWLLLKFHALTVEEEWTEGERDFLYIQIIHFKCTQYVSHFPFCEIYFFFSCRILVGRNIKGSLWDHWPWLIGYLGLYWAPFVFYSYQMQISEFNGKRKTRIERTRDKRGCESSI